MVVVGKENNRNVMVVMEEENNRNVVVVVVYKCATFYLFLGLHSAPEKLTSVGSVPFAKNRQVERIACKGM